MTKATDRARELRKRKRLEIFELLGNKCARCGISDQRVLQIDHISGGGRHERMAFKSNHPYYSHVIEELKHGSKDYQLLCANCNNIKLIEAKEDSRLIDSPHTKLYTIKPSQTKSRLKEIESMAAATGSDEHLGSIDKCESETSRSGIMESIEITASELAEIGKDSIRLLGSRGTIEIISMFCCSGKHVRFNELSRLLDYISTKTLASRLKMLGKFGILKRTAYNEIPPRVEYSMTEEGQKLAEAIAPLLNWIIAWGDHGKRRTINRAPGDKTMKIPASCGCLEPSVQLDSEQRKSEDSEKRSG
jgi:DNA-binding HxlR family transcriptional regulator